MIDKKSLFIGLLIGICICLAVVLFSEPKAYATPLQGQPRYQIAAGNPEYGIQGITAYCYVMDAQTGTVYAASSQKGKLLWRLFLPGPPR